MKYGDTPLHRACYSGHADIVEILCKRQDLIINIINDQGVTPLQIAVSKGYNDIVNIICNKMDQ